MAVRVEGTGSAGLTVIREMNAAACFMCFFALYCTILNPRPRYGYSTFLVGHPFLLNITENTE